MLAVAFGAQNASGIDTDTDATPAAGGAEAVSDAAERSWTWLAGQVGWTDADALRERLPGVSVADILWLRVAMDTDRMFLEQPGITAEWMLDDPAHQIVRTASAEVSATGMAAAAGDTAAFTRLALGAGGSSVPALRALDTALWDAYGDRLGEHAHRLREETGAGTTMFLWVRHAAAIDRDALERLRVSAHDLVHMADYQLARKLAADAYVRSVVECVRCATPSAPYYGDDCGAPDGRRCRLPEDRGAALCRAYLPGVVHPASGLARCATESEDVVPAPKGRPVGLATPDPSRAATGGPRTPSTPVALGEL